MAEYLQVEITHTPVSAQVTAAPVSVRAEMTVSADAIYAAITHPPQLAVSAEITQPPPIIVEAQVSQAPAGANGAAGPAGPAGANSQTVVLTLAAYLALSPAAQMDGSWYLIPKT